MQTLSLGIKIGVIHLFATFGVFILNCLIIERRWIKVLLRILKQGRLEIRSAFIVFEKDAEGGYTQISDFGSEPQIYLIKELMI